jgi:phosphoserine phosphatase RsbX
MGAMIGSGSHQSPIIEIGSAGRALAAYGEGNESGDLHAVVPFEGGTLVAVIDGLGHGTEAAVAARAAAAVLQAHPGEPVQALVRRCHQGLRSTRGAVISMASFRAYDSSMTWIGVGNVDGVLLRADPAATPRREVIATRGGVVGFQLPSLHSATLRVSRGDIVLLATDGIRTRFSEGVALERSPQEIADSILLRHNRGNDDALVVVVRYLGGDALSDALRSALARVPIREEADVAMARKHTRDVAIREGLPEATAEAMVTAISEIARNIVVHAGAGEVVIGALAERGRRGVVVAACDQGPGIADPERAFEDGYTTAGGLGLGLSSARRLVDEFELVSRPGEGTTVVMKKWAP